MPDCPKPFTVFLAACRMTARSWLRFRWDGSDGGVQRRNLAAATAAAVGELEFPVLNAAAWF